MITQKTFFELIQERAMQAADQAKIERVADDIQRSYRMKRDKALELAKRTLCPPPFEWKT